MKKETSKITKRPILKPTAPLAPVVEDKEAEKFIGGAPDSVPTGDTRKGVIRGKREQISHTLPPDLLVKIDARANKIGLTRAGFINFVISEYLKQ
jgi:hypothetical protein